MRIAFTGGGTGGHFFPIIAVAQALQDIVEEENLLEPELYYLSKDPYNEKLLFEYGIQYVYVPSGKWRRYFSFLNFVDIFKLGFGVCKALLSLFRIYPDVLFSKGGYTALPVVAAARILGIPVIMHESDYVPGRANAWTGTFALKVAVSYPETVDKFSNPHTVLTGVPIRKELLHPVKEGAHAYLGLKDSTPTIFVLGGSQGAKRINDVILDGLPKMVERYQIIHQVGGKNIEEVESIARVVLEDNEYAHRYKPFAFLDALAMRMAAGAADVVVTRAGSSLFEIAAWGVPSIIIPIPEHISHDQRKNAFAFARAGAGIVIEENNFTDDLLISQIQALLENKEEYTEMSKKAQSFVPTDAGRKIAKALVDVGLSHES